MEGRVGKWPQWRLPQVEAPPDWEVLGHEPITWRELRKYRSIAGHLGGLMHHRIGSVRNHLRKVGCPEPEATWIARAACGKRVG